MEYGYVSKAVAKCNAPAEEYWKTGMLLSKDSNTLLIELNEETWELNLRLVGSNPTVYFMDLVENMDTLIEDSLQVQVRKLALCPHCIRCGHSPPLTHSLRTSRLTDTHASPSTTHARLLLHSLTYAKHTHEQHSHTCTHSR